MKTQFRIVSILILVLAISFLFCKNNATAQDSTSIYEPHHNTYISFGAGASFVNGMPSDIYTSSNTNLQIGMMYEKTLHKRFSVIAGLEFEQLTYNFDGDIALTSPSTVNVVKAGTDKKYTGIRQRNLAFPIQLRGYFLDNNNADIRNMFVQGGLRFVQTLDFTGADPLKSTYFFRSADQDEELHLTKLSRQSILQAELMIGFKGKFFKKFDLLNSSTIGVMYQLTPMFNENSTQLRPLHVTWRFLF